MRQITFEIIRNLYLWLDRQINRLSNERFN